VFPFFTAVVAFALIYLLFLFWYGGRGRPLAPDEVDTLLERVQQSSRAVGAPMEQNLLNSLREVVQDDDGREFVMVNLIRFRTKAVYPPGWDHGDDAHAADARYNRAVVPRLLKRACIPVFLGRAAGRFLSPDGADDWDCVAVVRYRSRRDLLGLCVDLAKDRADVHKWAAIEKTHVFPVRARFGLFQVRLTVAALLAVCMGILALAMSLFA
jgi:hypothetical protein